jgi:ketosteroid isomerase-like protein
MAAPFTEDFARRVIELLNSQDWAALGELMHPEFEFRSALTPVEGTEVHRGIEGFAALMEEFGSIWNDLQWTVESFRSTGEGAAIVQLRVRGVAAGSGIPLDQAVTQVWRMRDGMMFRGASFTDPAEALAAAGLDA